MFPAASAEQAASALERVPYLPEEADTRGDEGGGLDREVPATRPSWFRRTREILQGSVWAPVALKLAGLLLGVLVLSGVGIASIVSASSGAQVSLAGMLGSDVHAAWLAAKPVASARSANSASAANANVASAATSANAAPNAVAPSASAAAEAKPDSAASAAKSDTGMTQDGRVILNLASASDLRHLPGVGQKRADAILALRARLGGHFKHVNDLLRVKGIGVRGLKKILPHVVLDAPVAPAV